MKIYQQAITLQQRKRGFHLITAEIIGHARDQAGQCRSLSGVHPHTSASLTINENADPTVRKDFETYFNKPSPETIRIICMMMKDPMICRTPEAALLGSSVLIPIVRGELALGTWQGIYLCEHRNQGGSRELVITCWESNSNNSCNY